MRRDDYHHLAVVHKVTNVACLPIISIRASLSVCTETHGIRTVYCNKVCNNYLEVLLAMEYDALGFDFPVFDVHLVAAEDYGNVLTDTHQVTMPVGYVLVGDSGRDIKHDDRTLGWRAEGKGVEKRRVERKEGAEKKKVQMGIQRVKR